MKKILLSLFIGSVCFLTANSQTLNNSGFENWDVDSSSGTPVWNPTGWFTLNFGETDPDGVSKSSDAHGGQLSAKIIPTTFFGIPFPGLLGYVDATNQKLKYLNGYYKSTLAAKDTFMIGIEYTNSKTSEHYIFAQLASGSKTSWTPFNIQVDLPSSFTPDTFNISIIVFGEEGVSGMVDDLSFSNTPIGSAFGKAISTSVKDISKTARFNEKFYPNPATDVANLDFYMSTPGKAQIIISDILGKELNRIDNNQILHGPQHFQIDTRSLQPGIYFYTILTSTGKITRKFTVSN